MYPVLKIFNDVEAAVIRWSRLGVVAAVGVSAALVASPAHATSPPESCAGYHSWTECVSFNDADSDLAVNVENGYSVAQNEAVWITVNGSAVTNQSIDIPANSWRGYAQFYNLPEAAEVCAGIGVVQIVCGIFS
jgi:hypothetical protein